ncbi:MAG: hypothetical protein K2P93_07420 [Alphaproteobacteria bacterium]|nr:hypothetical protein [Alphaproteobacteria bacterium]
MKSIAFTLAVLLVAANVAQAETPSSDAPSAPTAQASSNPTAPVKNADGTVILEEVEMEAPAKSAN